MHEEKIKVESLDIIVTITGGKPYYSIKYKEVGNRYYNVGYSSFNLDFVLEWRKQYFEVAEAVDAKDTNVHSKWIPCRVRLPEESGYYLACVYDEEADDYDIRKNWFAHRADYDIDKSEWRELYHGEKVVAWTALPEPYKEKTE